MASSAPKLPLSLRNVVKREHHGLFAFVCVLFFLEWLGDAFYVGSLEPEPLWLAFFALNAALYLACRMLKKHTRYLHAEGR